MVLSGEASPEDIDEYIEIWHERDRTRTLREFLGFTQAEYELWLAYPEKLKDIIDSR